MKSPALIGLAWVATVAIAFLLGGKLRPEASARDARTQADSRVTAAPDAPSPAHAEEARPPADAAQTAAPGGPAAVEEVKPVAIEPGMPPADLSSLFMRYAASKLAQGPEGHKELFRELDRLMRDKQLKEVFRDESQVMPFVYPWVKFLVDHDRQVVAMMETIYKTAAEDPQWFQGLDDDPMEMLAEGLALLLPGVVGEEQLARFRGYAEQIIALPKESLPEALAKNLSDIQRDIEWWSPPIKPEELVQALNDPGVPLAKKIGLLRTANPASLGGVDVTSILAGGIREGSSQAMYVLQRFLDSATLAVVDAAFLDAVASGGQQWHQISTYASVTRRNTWETLRPFLETGLARGGKATEAFAQSLVLFRHLEVPKEYVANVVAVYPLPDQVRNQIKKQYAIE